MEDWRNTLAPNLLATVFKTQIRNGSVSDLSVGGDGDGGGNSVRVREREEGRYPPPTIHYVYPLDNFKSK